jgi:hypothetical protein
MKIDLYNNHETYIKESKQDWDISRWLKSKGMTLKDLEYHPRMDDLVTLLQIRTELFNRMSPKEQATWAAYWSLVKGQQYPLTKKFWKKMERITQDIDYRDQLLAEQRQRIMALRIEPLKRDHDNKANGSHSHSSHTWTVAYESATDCPYF